MSEPIIDIDGLSFTYPDGSMGLKDISFRVDRGENTAVIGPNGAGKSTLLLHLNGVLRGTGKVRVLGREIAKKDLPWIRGRVGIVFQDPNDQLFMPTVYEDVAFGPLNKGLPHEEVRRRAMSMLARFHLEGSKDKDPSHLSLGERKKAALATALVTDPRILVLDEPMVSLDPGSRRMFLDLLKGLNQTLLVATHDMDLALDLCPRAVLMAAGRVVVAGKTPELLRNRDLMESYSLEVPFRLRTT